MLDARVREREGCVLEADKWGDIARVVTTILREVVVEIIFALRVVSVILRCRAAAVWLLSVQWRSYSGRRYRFQETLRD